MNAHTPEALKQLQSLSLEVKIMLTVRRIEAFRTYANSNDYDVYVSFSGGKDSTILKHIVETRIDQNIPSVFFNTGLELTQIQEFVKKQDNVKIIYPKKSFIEVIKEYGYPVISKEVSEAIESTRKGAKWATEKLEGVGLYSGRYNFSRYKFLREAPFKISKKCCNVLKKEQAYKYGKENKRYPLIATLADESELRRKQWIKLGCNITGKHPHSNPLSFWTEQDILEYIDKNNIEIAKCYGEVRYKDVLQKERYLSGVDRTGCAFCLFGATKDKRFLYLKRHNPNQYNFALNGGKFNEQGLWEPTKEGLGLKYVIDYLNARRRDKILY